MTEVAEQIEESKEVAKAKIMEIAVGGEITPIIPHTYQEAHEMALAFCKAGIIPRGLEDPKGDNSKTLGMVTTAIMQGLEVGMPPVAAISNIMVVNGRPTIWGDGAVALIHSSGTVEYFREWIEGDEYTDTWVAKCCIKRKDQDEPFKGSFSWADAQKAKLPNKPGPWMTYPKRMMQMRARAFAVRDGFADVLKGLKITEEVQDIPVPKEVKTTEFLEE